MKKIFIFFIILLTFCNIAVAKALAIDSNGLVINIAYDVTPSPPYSIGKGTEIDYNHPGLTPDFLLLVAKNTELTIKFKRVPWKRALHLIKTNKVSAIFHSSFKKERMDFGVYPFKNNKPDVSRCIYIRNYVFYKLKSSSFSWDGKKVNNLDGPVGINLGFAIEEDLQEMGLQVDTADYAGDNLDKLKKKRIAVYADLERLADNVINQNPFKYNDIVKISPPLRTKPYYLMFNKEFYKNHSSTVEKVWDTIRDLKTSEEFRKLKQKYNFEPN